MSDEDRVQGPVMLAATNMLKPPPPVIGSLNNEIALPRTIRLHTLIAAGAGAVLGFMIGIFIFGAGLHALIYGPILGGGLGWMAVNTSPLQGESLATWLGLQANQVRKRKLVVDGRQVRLYVGIAPLHRTAAGTVRMLPGGLSVDAVRWDSRGFPQQEIPGAPHLARRARRRRATTPKRSGGHGLRGKLRARARR